MAREYFKERFFPPGMVRDDQVYYWYFSDGVWTVMEYERLEEYRVPGKIYYLQAVTRGNYELLYCRDQFEYETGPYHTTAYSDGLPYTVCDNDGDMDVERRFKSGLVVSYNTPDEYFGPKNKYQEHLDKMLEMHELYYTKNKDYGDAFTQSLDKYGPIAALVRMEDKWNRLSNLITKGEEGLIKSESVEDTLIDLANYAIMTSLYLRGNKTDD